MWNGGLDMLTLGVCVWFCWAYLAQTTLPGIEVREEIKLICALQSRGTGGSTPPQRALTQAAAAPYLCWGRSCGPCTGSGVLNEDAQRWSQRTTGRSGRAVTLCVSVLGDGLLRVTQAHGDWPGYHLWLRTEGLGPRRTLVAKPHRHCSYQREKKDFPVHMPFHFWQKIQLHYNLWDHRTHGLSTINQNISRPQVIVFQKLPYRYS